MNIKIIVIIVAVVVLGTAGYLLFWNGNGNSIVYQTEKVSRGDISIQVRATGTINPLRTVRVGSQVSGTIAKLFADFNTVVRQGEIIALIDSTFLSASVKEAEANRERNAAQMNEAKRSLDRMRELFSKALVAQAEMDAAQTAFEAAQAGLKQSEAALDRARVNLRYSVIRAPIDGVVISRDVDVGQTVAASLQAPQLFSIANDLSRMQVEASVDEADIGQIMQGQEVAFTVDAYPELQFAGTVTQVRLAPINVQNVITYTVVIDVPNPDLRLRPGMTATVSILIERHENALRISTLAIRFQPPASIVEKYEARREEKAGSLTKSTSSDTTRGERRRGMMREGGRKRSEGTSQRSSRPTRIWVMGDGNTIAPVMVRLGLNDTRYMEVLGDEMKEGDEVVIGMTGPERTSATQQTNPFAPRTGGGQPRTRGF